MWSVHLDGDQEDHDRSVCQDGVYDRAVKAIKAAKARGFRVNINCTLFNNAVPERVAAFFDTVMALERRRHHGIAWLCLRAGTRSGAFPQPAQDQASCSATSSAGAATASKWSFSQSGHLFLDFLAGNQNYHCTPWGNPTRNYFGWQRPCYLLGEGFTSTFKELMETTDWDAYGTGNYEKCADCMVHCGYEATAVVDAGEAPAEGDDQGDPRRPHRRRHGDRRSRSIANAPPNSCSRAMSRTRWTG